MGGFGRGGGGGGAAKIIKRPPQPPAVRQLLGSANTETTPTRNTGRSGRRIALTRRSTRRGERVTVQGPVKKQQPDGMPRRGSLALRALLLGAHPATR